MIVGERKGMRLADMRHRVTLAQPTKTIDASRQPVITWTTELEDQPARYTQVTGGEIVRGRQVEAGANALFTVGYRSNYMVEKQIQFRGLAFGILRIDAIDGINRYLDLHCKTIVSEQ